jgi:hypothetical protein
MANRLSKTAMLRSPMHGAGDRPQAPVGMLGLVGAAS